MASTMKQTVTIGELSKWGPKVGDEYFSFSKKIKEADKARIVPGAVLELDLYVADSGKKYINSVLGNSFALEAPKLVAPVFKDTPVAKPIKAAASKKSEEMTRADWDAKDLRISRQGVIQAAVQAVAGFSTQEDLYKNAEELANKMLAFVNHK